MVASQTLLQSMLLAEAYSLNRVMWWPTRPCSSSGHVHVPKPVPVLGQAHVPDPDQVHAAGPVSHLALVIQPI